MVIIGVDPALRKKGFAICILDTESKIAEFQIIESFVDFIIYVENSQPDTVFAVENSNLQKVSFDMKGNKGVLARKSRNVGMNQAISQLACDYIKTKGFEIIEISPRRKGEKWTHIQTLLFMNNHQHKFKNYKGLVTDQDKRDAYKLALIVMNEKKLKNI